MQIKLQMETFTFAFFEGANIRWTIFWCPTPFSRRNLVSSCERASAFWPRSCLRGRAWVLKSVPYLKKTFRNFVASSRVDKTWSGIVTIGLSSSSTDQVFTHTSVCTPTYLYIPAHIYIGYTYTYLPTYLYTCPYIHRIYIYIPTYIYLPIHP